MNMCEDGNGARYRAAFLPGKRKFGFFYEETRTDKHTPCTVRTVFL
jgi:hypothetical protein